MLSLEPSFSSELSNDQPRLLVARGACYCEMKKEIVIRKRSSHL